MLILFKAFLIGTWRGLWRPQPRPTWSRKDTIFNEIMRTVMQILLAGPFERARSLEQEGPALQRDHPQPERHGEHADGEADLGAEHAAVGVRFPGDDLHRR